MTNSGSEEAQRHALDRRLPFFGVAEELFVRHGFERTTVEEICRATRASKRTFYQLFRNKLDLLVQLSLHVAEEIVGRWKERSAGESSATVRLKLFIREYERIGREREILRVLVSAPGALSSETDITIFKDSPLMAAMNEILEHGAATGEFRVSDPTRMSWVIFTYLDSTYYLLPMMERRSGPLDDEELAAEVRSLLIYGLLTRVPNGDDHES